MGNSAGPRQVLRDSLLLSIDGADFPNSAMPLGCGDTNGVTQGMRSNTNGAILPFVNGTKLTNRDFYTGIGVSYPEGSYGGDAANRQGLTPGYNVRSGGKTYDASRSLHLWVWHRPTSTWIEGYFNGARLGGHCYDNYAGAENGWENEMTKFVADYNTIKSIFDDCIYVLIGSHACQSFRQADIEVLVELGAPRSVVSSWTDNSAWREFVLVGKPGLQDGKAFGWAYQNYPTNPDQVAHLNFGIPKTGTRSSIEFDGSNDYLAHPSPSSFRMSGQNFTLETVIKQYDTGYQGLLEARGDSLVGYLWILNYGNAGGMAMFLNYGGNQYVHYQNGGFSVTSTSQYYHLVTVVNRSAQVVQFYINGVQAGSNVSTQHQESISPTGGDYYHVGWDRGGSPLYGEMALFNHYNKALSAQEIAKNYANYKTRFGI